MGVIKPLNRRMYWGSKAGADFITSSMSIIWFDEIVSVLYFNDNNNLPDRGSPFQSITWLSNTNQYELKSK